MSEEHNQLPPQAHSPDVESLKNSVNSLNNLLLGLQGYISFMESAAASQQQDVSYLGPMKELVTRACDVANNIYSNMRGLPPGQRLSYPVPPISAGGPAVQPFGLSESVLTPPRDYNGPLQTTAPPPPMRDRRIHDAPGTPHSSPAAGTPPPPAREDLSQQHGSRVPPQVSPIPAAPRMPMPQKQVPNLAPPAARIPTPTQPFDASKMPPPPPAPAAEPPPIPQESHIREPAPESVQEAYARRIPAQLTCPADIPALANLEVINREGTRGLVMLVDDEEHLLYIASRMLAGEGFSVINCEEVFEAISIFEKVGKYVDLVILDFSMPTMNGEDVFYELTDIDPSVRIVLSSGIFEQEVISRLLKKGLKAFLPKPYKKESLLQTVSAAIGKR